MFRLPLERAATGFRTIYVFVGVHVGCENGHEMTFVMNYICDLCVCSRARARARGAARWSLPAGVRAGAWGTATGRTTGACGTPRRAIARATGGPWGGLFTHRRGSMPHRARLEGALRLQELGVVLIRVRCRRLG